MVLFQYPKIPPIYITTRAIYPSHFPPDMLKRIRVPFIATFQCIEIFNSQRRKHHFPTSRALPFDVKEVSLFGMCDA